MVSKYFYYILGGLILGIGTEFITKTSVKAACRPILEDVNRLLPEAKGLVDNAKNLEKTTPKAGS